jgi:hypothetical protein
MDQNDITPAEAPIDVFNPISALQKDEPAASASVINSTLDDKSKQMITAPTTRIKKDIANAIRANTNTRLTWEFIEKFLKDAGYSTDEINAERLKAEKFAPHIFKGPIIKGI